MTPEKQNISPEIKSPLEAGKKTSDHIKGNPDVAQRTAGNIDKRLKLSGNPQIKNTLDEQMSKDILKLRNNMQNNFDEMDGTPDLRNNPDDDGFGKGKKYNNELSKQRTEIAREQLLMQNISVLSNSLNKFGIDINKIVVSPWSKIESVNQTGNTMSFVVGGKGSNVKDVYSITSYGNTGMMTKLTFEGNKLIKKYPDFPVTRKSPNTQAQESKPTPNSENSAKMSKKKNDNLIQKEKLTDEEGKKLITDAIKEWEKINTHGSQQTMDFPLTNVINSGQITKSQFVDVFSKHLQSKDAGLDYKSAGRKALYKYGLLTK